MQREPLEIFVNDTDNDPTHPTSPTVVITPAGRSSSLEEGALEDFALDEHDLEGEAPPANMLLPPGTTLTGGQGGRTHLRGVFYHLR